MRMLTVGYLSPIFFHEVAADHKNDYNTISCVLFLFVTPIQYLHYTVYYLIKYIVNNNLLYIHSYRKLYISIHLK